MSLILTWAVLLSSIILIYILLDGFDLGIGILFPWISGQHSRDIMMSTVAPVWDGNETWLVFGAAALYGAFPIAYGVLMPILYMPIMFMLLALIFRGVAFEFRFKAEKSQAFWDIAFAAGSTIAALMQGMILGTFVQGYGTSIPTTQQGHPWITPFSFLTGLAVVIGYALLGATWLIIKTEGELQQRFFHIAKRLLLAVAGCLSVICLWTLFLELRILERWMMYKHVLWIIPTITSAIIGSAFYCLQKGYEKPPFLLSVGIFACSYIGFGISLWPYVIPYSLKFWDAAAPASSLRFSLIGTIIILPMLLAYTAYTYYVFRGKVTKTIHY
jgi:cytochrome d ubiquinol oxidase subunit II